MAAEEMSSHPQRTTNTPTFYRNCGVFIRDPKRAGAEDIHTDTSQPAIVAAAAAIATVKSNRGTVTHVALNRSTSDVCVCVCLMRPATIASISTQHTLQHNIQSLCRTLSRRADKVLVSIFSIFFFN